MSSLALLVTAITVIFLGVMITSVAATTRNDRRRNTIWAAEWAAKIHGRAVATGYLRPAATTGGPRRQALPAPAAAIGAGSGAAAEPEAGIERLSEGARVQLNDGRTGTVLAIEPGAQVTRVHLDLDTGDRGYVDLPGTAPTEPVAQPQPVPRPVALVPALPALSAPAAAPVAAAASTTVRLGGFSIPVTRADGRP
jgi:hypothetical protein